MIDWAGPCPERCHGGKIIFKDQFSEQSNLNLREKFMWSESPLRLLHTCFMKRSTLEIQESGKGRKNPYEIYSMSRMTKWFSFLRKMIKMPYHSDYKIKKYMRGSLVEEEISVFFPA